MFSTQRCNLIQYMKRYDSLSTEAFYHKIFPSLFSEIKIFFYQTFHLRSLLIINKKFMASFFISYNIMQFLKKIYNSLDKLFESLNILLFSDLS